MPNVYEPAFPVESPNGDGMCSGMDLRDYFAAAALPAVISTCARDTLPPDCTRAQYFASQALWIADAMLKLREES